MQKKFETKKKKKEIQRQCSSFRIPRMPRRRNKPANHEEEGLTDETM